MPYGPLPKGEEVRLTRNAKAREMTKVKKFGENFYVLDTETSGLIKNEPV